MSSWERQIFERLGSIESVFKIIQTTLLDHGAVSGNCSKGN